MKKELLLSLLIATTALQAFRQANTSLSNLASPTSVNQILLANADNTKNFGSTGKSWKDIYLDGDLYIDGSRWLANPAGDNTMVGKAAGLNTTGADNTFIGKEAGVSNTTGYSNTFIGE